MPGRRWRGATTRVLGGGALGVVVAAGMAVGGWEWFGGGRTSPLDGVPLAQVVRGDLVASVVVRGDIDGADSTRIDCEVEAVHVDGSAAQGPTIIELVDDGTWARKDDVILRFDTSNLEEMVRRQRIEVDRAEAERRQAELELGAAEVALAAFRDGEVIETGQSLQGRIALLRSDLEQARARLAWSERMQGIGYSSSTDLANDRISLQRLQVDLSGAEAAYRNHLRFQVPKGVRELEVRVEQARDQLAFCELQFENHRKQLEHDLEQISKCTVRAPHDGMVIRVAEHLWGDEYRMRVGASVYQGIPLFTIPDLSRPIVDISLNQTIASRVTVGMPAEVQIDALPGRIFQGRVESIEQLPTTNWQAGWDVLHLMARVVIEDPPSGGLLPSMTASVRIITSQQPDTLMIPGEALAVDAAGSYCIVASDRGAVERRAVVVEPADIERVKVVDGLTEGEWVVLDPASAIEPNPVRSQFARVQ